MSVFITGGTGRLGIELIKEAKKHFDVVLAPSRQELDLINDAGIRVFIEKHKPDFIIHSAAITSLEKCEENMVLAWAVNAEATRTIFECGKRVGARMCLVSTPSVFMGGQAPFKEYSSRLPLRLPEDINNYALSKIGAENYAARYDAVIIRTNFVTRNKYPHKQAFTDRVGNWVYIDQAAAEIIRILLRSDLKGTFHVCGKESLSMFDIAKKTNASIMPMTMSDYGKVKLMIDQRLESTRWPKVDTFKKVR